jgi:C1A family cysteine protease
MKNRLLLLCLGLIFSQISYGSDELQEVRAAIARQNASWQAGENWVTQLSPAERRQLLGARRDHPWATTARLIQLPKPKSMPNHFDWRDNGGNWVTPVRNQGNCGSCWDFSACAQIEAWWKIYHNQPTVDLDLSEQFVLSCHDDNGGCEGDWVETVLNYAIADGIPLESCFGYYAADTIPCSWGCADWQSGAVKIPGWGYITLEEDLIDNIKAAILQHPVSASYVVYSDFYYYTSGIYEHTGGTEEGGHAILIVGWDDAERCWICKNSWGPNWGENGYFRIRWSNCEMGTYIPFIYDEMLNVPSLALSTKEVNFNLEVGDTAEAEITISNSGTGELVYSAIDYQMPLMWHIDSFQSYDGSSWWCASPAIGGYGDHWLQYLETPVIDLSNTTQPILSFRGKWDVEDPAGAEAPYDGWDGCNVWISTDGGQTFQVLRPESPAYNCEHLWSFGHPEQGWNLGENVAGWAGSSNGWQNVIINLENYRYQNVIIRWAFASDMAYSTIDNPALTGYFVDQIRVMDGQSVIFSNDGDTKDQMQLVGFGTDKAEWLSLFNGAGTINPGGNANVKLKAQTHLLSPGEYYARIVFMTNELSSNQQEILCHLNLAPAQHDIAVDEFWLPMANLPLLVKANIGAQVSNRGQNSESNFNVICHGVDGNRLVYADTVRIDSLAVGVTTTVKFKPLLFSDSHTLQFNVYVDGVDLDRNLFNNVLQTNLTASNFVDGFEEDIDFWMYEGGWAPTRAIDHHSGAQAAHCYAGTKPYPTNMNACLTFRPGFYIKGIPYAHIAFWSIYQIETDKDFCYVELSTDSTNWTNALTLTGAQTRWKMFKVDLSSVLGGTAEKVWIRFRFVSDANAGNYAGILIDDVYIYLEPASQIELTRDNHTVSQTFALEQNYPNPFNPTTNISYQLPVNTRVKLALYNYRGEMVRVLVDGQQEAGYYHLKLDFSDLPSGIYFYHLKAGNFSQTRKCLLIK